MPRLATPYVPEQTFSTVSSQTTRKPKKMSQIVLTAIAFTVACLAWAMETNSNSNNFKIEQLRTVQEFLNQESGKKN